MAGEGTDARIRRWRRYGKDRLYVTDAAGQQLGWVDLATGATTLERPGVAGVVQESVSAFCSNLGLPNPFLAIGSTSDAAASRPTASSGRLADPAPTAGDATPPAAENGGERPGQAWSAVPEGPAPAAPPATAAAAAAGDREHPGWADLADNVPGQAARARAEAELAAMRERSRVGTFLARAFDVKTDERAWRVGSGGEETVGAKLNKLEKHGWHVLHAVPVGDSDTDIDHVVIGHGGVYTVNTKTHPGGRIWVGKHQVRVNGFATDYLRKSRAEAARAAKLLTAAVGFQVTVHPALVFLTGTLIPNVTIRQQPDDVLILDRMHIPGVLRRAPRRLAPEQSSAIYAHARRSTTWKPPRAPRSRG